ncbi:hypothetical protein [Galbibacter pacificus]|uniref:Uncharacterized protein n=1 Tax=Galbibacter pacificus TaxID=2996052 RepID=A0ABT6FT23_9FLAO|nr:hypothetical protein [Galbibacter pacificus]MDG3582464.1 hypothetical protein [Galbibacter pacificus]MDG3586418.1 hypothetical protein [Galbibacter pacificus]
MKEEKRINISTKKHVRQLYTVNSNLKEVYNECQYYMSHTELKEFYEKSFFSKNNFSNNLYSYLKVRNKGVLFITDLKTSYFISCLTFQLIFQKNKIRFLFKKALKLEERNFELLKKLLKTSVLPESLVPILKNHHDSQATRIAAIKKVLKDQQ